MPVPIDDDDGVCLIDERCIYFVTGNAMKEREVNAILAAEDLRPFRVQHVDIDLPELQGDAMEIACDAKRLEPFSRTTLSSARPTLPACDRYQSRQVSGGCATDWRLSAHRGHVAQLQRAKRSARALHQMVCDFARTGGPVLTACGAHRPQRLLPVRRGLLARARC